MTQCSFSCSLTFLSGNLKLTFFSWLLLHKHIVLKLLVCKVCWVDVVDRGPQAVSLERQKWCGLCCGDFSFPLSNSALQFIRHEIKSITFSPFASLKSGEGQHCHWTHLSYTCNGTREEGSQLLASKWSSCSAFKGLLARSYAFAYLSIELWMHAVLKLS